MAASDRRIVRTRRLLREALFELIAEHGYENLTVNEIADHADVGRATFYLHYKDKDDLLQQALRDEFEAFAQFMQANYNVEDRLGLMLKYVSERTLHFRVLLISIGKPNVFIFTRNFMALHMIQRVRERLEAEKPAAPPSIPLPIIANHMAGSILNLIIWWLENNQPCTIEQLEIYCQQLIGDGVWKVLNLDANANML